MQLVRLFSQSVLVFIATLLFACNIKPVDKPLPNDTVKKTKLRTVTFVTPKGSGIITELAIKEVEQVEGLSGRPSEEFGSHQGMLFYYKESGVRSFWMPDTYFNLNIYFLDENLKIVDAALNVPAHPGREEPPRIHRTAPVYARHVLEIRADSPLAKELSIGSSLSFQKKDSKSLSEIVQEIHP